MKNLHGTTVVVFRDRKEGRIHIAADGAVSCGTIRIEQKNKKIVQCPGYTLVTSGCIGECQQIRRAIGRVFSGVVVEGGYPSTLEDALVDQLTPVKGDASGYLVLPSGDIYLVGCEGCVLKMSSDLMCLGSGGDIARGAILGMTRENGKAAYGYREATKEAIKIAAKFCGSTNDTIYTVSVHCPINSHDKED